MKYSGTKRVHQEDADAVYASELNYQLEKGAEPAWAKARAIKAAGRVEAEVNEPDGSRIRGSMAVDANAERQSRGGQVADLDSTLAALETVGAAIGLSTSRTQKDRLGQAIRAVEQPGAGNVRVRQHRMMMLRTWRKSIGTVISHRKPDRYPFPASIYADILLSIEAELAFLGGTGAGTMHVDNVTSILPEHAARVGIDALRDRWATLFRRYAAEHAEAALASVEIGAFKMPELVSSRGIGIALSLREAHLREYFPQGRHMIRACDRDAIDEDRRKRGLKVRTKPKAKTRQEIRVAAAEQREREELMTHFGVKRDTIAKWHRRGTYFDRLERMENDKARGVPAASPGDLSPELRQALQDRFGVGAAAIRQWRKRGELAARVAQYRNETTLQIVA